MVDFIDLGWEGYRFWTFNVADVGITAGASLLLLSLCAARSRRSGMTRRSGARHRKGGTPLQRLEDYRESEEVRGFDVGDGGRELPAVEAAQGRSGVGPRSAGRDGAIRPRGGVVVG